MASERRYSEEEFALILRKASELHEGRTRGGPEAATSGLSLTEIQAIAREVGLDPDKVARAASMLPTSGGDEGKGFLGGPVKLLYEAEVPGTLAESDLSRVLDAIRRELKHQGEAVDVLGSLEWKSIGFTNQIHVTVTPREDSVLVRVIADRSAAAALSTIFPFIGWALATGITAGATGVTGLAAVGVVAGGVLGAAVSIRTLWTLTARRLGRTLRGLLTALTDEVSALTAREPEAARPPDDKALRSPG